MEKFILDLINESIRIETNLSKLYYAYSKLFTADSEFWSQLASEERDHASLIHSARTLSTVTDNFPEDLLSNDLQKLISSNQMIEKYISTSDSLTHRLDAAKIALKIEGSSSELSFQKFMKKAPENELSKIFIKLNYFDLDHTKRICEYFKII